MSGLFVCIQEQTTVSLYIKMYQAAASFTGTVFKCSHDKLLT